MGQKIGLTSEGVADFQQVSTRNWKEKWEERARRREYKRGIPEIDLQRVKVELQRAGLSAVSKSSNRLKVVLSRSLTVIRMTFLFVEIWNLYKDARVASCDLGYLFRCFAWRKKLMVYALLPSHHSQDYDTLKKALLGRF